MDFCGRSLLLKIFAFPVISLFTTMQIEAQQKELPNILLFHADDMTWRDCEPYGNTDVITPNISRLAKEGMCFDNMHTSMAMCSPTRQSLYTGLHPVRSGAYANHSMVHFGVKSVCHYFGDLGYRVALVGKTHHNPVESFPFEFLGGRHHDNGNGIDIHIDRIKPLISQEENPFFIVVSSNQPHTPWNRGPVDLYDEKSFTIPEYMVDSERTRHDLKRYYAEISYTDSLLGVCMDYLEEAGKLKNTIVIFTSEQGSAFPMAKWTCYDLGLKTAFIVKWPGKVKPGSRNTALTQYSDVVPTLLEAAGILPDKINTGIEDNNGNQGFDGSSFLDVLLSNKAEHHEYVFGLHTTRGIYSGSECYPVRSVRSKQYKYILNLNSSSSFLNTVIANSNGIYQHWLEITKDDSEMRNYVMRYTLRPKEELYDVENDPYELINLAEKPEYASVKSSLIKELSQWMKVQGDEGIATEMNALSRIPRNLDGSWEGHEELENKRILNATQ